VTVSRFERVQLAPASVANTNHAQQHILALQTAQHRTAAHHALQPCPARCCPTSTSCSAIRHRPALRTSAQRCTASHSSAHQGPALHGIAQQRTPAHTSAQHCTASHSSAQHRTVRHRAFASPHTAAFPVCAVSSFVLNTASQVLQTPPPLFDRSSLASFWWPPAHVQIDEILSI
jgi:hypothetical protein